MSVHKSELTRSFTTPRNPHKSSKDFQSDAVWESELKALKTHLKIPSNSTATYTIKKGTHLYHASYFKDPVSSVLFDTDKIPVLFFGLDIDISIWYVNELHGTQKAKKRNIPTPSFLEKWDGNFYLNVYKASKDFDAHALFSSITEINPGEFKMCWTAPCLHPQFAYHESVFDGLPTTLSTELTIPLSQMKTYVQFVESILVDKDLLWKNRATDISQFDPLDALIFPLRTFTICSKYFCE